MTGGVGFLVPTSTVDLELSHQLSTARRSAQKGGRFDIYSRKGELVCLWDHMSSIDYGLHFASNW